MRVCLVQMANGKGVALVDADDLDRVTAMRWWMCSNGYAQGYVGRGVRGRRHVLLHRFIMNAQRGTEVDHINHQLLDCRKSNLRIVDKSTNMQNRKGPTRRNKLGLRGVIAYQT